MPILGYRTQQSTDTTGTGTLALNAATSAMRSFQATFGSSARRVLYCISWAAGFEIGHGQFDGGSPGALTRATILASSNAGNPVALPAGTKDVFAVLEPSAREVLPLAAGATLSLADLGNLVVFTGAAPATLALPSVAVVPPGMGVLVRNSGTSDLVLDPAGTETVNGGATVTLNPGFAAELFNTGTGWTALLTENTHYIDQGALIGWAGDHAHGIGVDGAGTGISIQNAGAGGSANMPPGLICNYALFAGV